MEKVVTESGRGLTRRRLLQIAGLGVVSIVIEACARVIPAGPNSTGTSLGVSLTPTRRAQPTDLPQAAASATPANPAQVAITSNADFYTVAYNSERPDLPPDWKLAVKGNLDKPLVLTLDDIKGMPAVEEMRTLECISNPAGGPLISNAVWKGIRASDLLRLSGVKPDTKELKLQAFDGYSTAIPLALAMDEHSLLVYEMNGEPLPIEHGKPLRCLWPGHYGMKQPKWLTTIEAMTGTYSGYWESQGWSDDASILPSSRIDLPKEGETLTSSTLSMQGVAFSGASGIAKLEVSIDDGQTWQAANVVRGPTPYVWTNWSWNGVLPATGSFSLFARVTDGKGATQVPEGPSLLGSTFPNGTAEMHPVIVTFKQG